MPLYTVHVKVRSYLASTGEKVDRTMEMPIRADNERDAARHPEVDNMLPRLTEGLKRASLVYRNATLLMED